MDRLQSLHLLEVSTVCLWLFRFCGDLMLFFPLFDTNVMLLTYGNFYCSIDLRRDISIFFRKE